MVVAGLSAASPAARRVVGTTAPGHLVRTTQPSEPGLREPESVLVIDRGLTDRLDPLLGARLRPLRDRIDERAGIRIDEDGVVLRRLVRTRTLRWSTIDRIVLENRLDLGVSFATRFVPVGRVPVLGERVRDAAGVLAETATRRLIPGVRENAGWVLASFARSGLMRDDIELDAAGALTALLHPDITAALELHAERRGIPVVRS